MEEKTKLVTLADLESRGLCLHSAEGADLVVTPEDVVRFLVREGKASNQEAVLFLAFCALRGLSPLEDDAYLVKYDEGPARIIMGKHGWLKLASRHPNYSHHASGILVRTKEGKVESREGTVYEKDKEALVGGWAEVYRKDGPPYPKRVLLEEFNTGRRMWRTMPAVMVEKVALCNALREALPDLGLGVVVAEEEVEEGPQAEEARQRRSFWASATRLGYSHQQVHQALGVESLNDWLGQGKSYAGALEVLRCHRLHPEAPAEPPELPQFKAFGEVAQWTYDTFGVGPMKVFADFNIGGWEEFPNPQKAAERIAARYGGQKA